MIKIVLTFQEHLPFAVVGSTDEVKVGKRMVRGRQYPWGVLQGKGNKDAQACSGMIMLKYIYNYKNYIKYNYKYVKQNILT